MKLYNHCWEQVAAPQHPLFSTFTVVFSCTMRQYCAIDACHGTFPACQHIEMSRVSRRGKLSVCNTEGYVTVQPRKKQNKTRVYFPHTLSYLWLSITVFHVGLLCNSIVRAHSPGNPRSLTSSSYDYSCALPPLPYPQFKRILMASLLPGDHLLYAPRSSGYLKSAHRRCNLHCYSNLFIHRSLTVRLNGHCRLN